MKLGSALIYLVSVLFPTGCLATPEVLNPSLEIVFDTNDTSVNVEDFQRRVQEVFGENCRSSVVDSGADLILLLHLKETEFGYLVSNTLVRRAIDTPIGTVSTAVSASLEEAYKKVMNRTFVFMNAWVFVANNRETFGEMVCKEYRVNFEDEYIRLLNG